MTLAAGTRLGPYEILAELGAGGMGEVYRAFDARLGRDVAIKVLPAELASDPERLRRFEREARSASSLNHPAIVTIHDVGTAGGIVYMTMELVRGRSLRQRLASGALPVGELLRVATQIAEGLAAAHAAGIVHRDLKPENVMLTEDGYAKILDFGLAKPAESEVTGDGATRATITDGATEPGVLLGTVGYMSPEQALGRAVDFRSDQFSFGAIVYEMATGRRAFARGSAPQTLSAIIEQEPEPMAGVRPAIPAPLRWIVERCLAKDPRQRYAATDDLARDLALLRERIAEIAGPVARTRTRPWLVPALLVLLLAAIGFAAWSLHSRDSTWRNPFAGAVFKRLTDWEGSEIDAAISRDGRWVSFLADRDGPLDSWVTQVGSGDFANLSRGGLKILPIDELRGSGFSEDDSHVWVRVLGDTSASSRETVRLLPVLGGNPQPFAVANAVELDWSRDPVRAAYHTPEPGDPIYVVDRSGSSPRMICRGEPGIHQHFPTWSPDGRYVYFIRGMPGISDLDVWRVAASGGSPERLTSLHAHVAYIAFLDARTLLFTAARPSGEGSGLFALDLERRVPHEIGLGLEDCLSIAASADGRRLVAALGRPDQNLWSVPILDHAVDEASARRERIPSVRASAPRFGPRGILYLSSRGGPAGLWKFENGTETELWRGADGAVPAAAAISPDGGRVCFVSRQSGRSRLTIMDADGSSPRLLASDLDARGAPAFSPDGKWVAAAAVDGGAKQPLFLVPAGGGPPRRLVDGVAFSPVWSPGGRFIVYGEGKSGGRSLQLEAVTLDGRPYPLPEIRVSRNSDAFRFTPDGRALIVMLGEMRAQDFWRLDLDSRKLTRLTTLKPGFEIRSFDVSPDGRRILFDRYRENADLALIERAPR